jgi:hypothetical protein
MKTSHIKRKILFRAHNNRVAIGTTHMEDGEVSNVCRGPYIYPSADLIDSSASQVHFFWARLNKVDLINERCCLSSKCELDVQIQQARPCDGNKFLRQVTKKPHSECLQRLLSE